jgi:hypothetical protein
MMKLSLKIIGPHSGKPLGAREQNAKNLELANALKVVADVITNGANEGQIRNGDLVGSSKPFAVSTDDPRQHAQQRRANDIPGAGARHSAPAASSWTKAKN